MLNRLVEWTLYPKLKVVPMHLVFGYQYLMHGLTLKEVMARLLPMRILWILELQPLELIFD
ncbi:hypothetical protein CR513_42391, partial [Mucuna pruriens]